MIREKWPEVRMYSSAYGEVYFKFFCAHCGFPNDQRRRNRYKRRMTAECLACSRKVRLKKE